MDVGTIVQPHLHRLVYLRLTSHFYHHYHRRRRWVGARPMREDQAKLKREEWEAKGRPPCEHRTLHLLYTAENYITGDYVCLECGELVGKVSKT
jgi:hypothetical protein